MVALEPHCLPSPLHTRNTLFGFLRGSTVEPRITSITGMQKGVATLGVALGGALLLRRRRRRRRQDGSDVSDGASWSTDATSEAGGTSRLGPFLQAHPLLDAVPELDDSADGSQNWRWLWLVLQGVGLCLVLGALQLALQRGAHDVAAIMALLLAIMLLSLLLRVVIRRRRRARLQASQGALHSYVRTMM